MTSKRWGAVAAVVVAMLIAGAYAGAENTPGDSLDPGAAKSLTPVGVDVASNPCNPCAGKNPCNPCAAKNACNPCAAKNACNPCGAKNPCNPCGGASVDPAKFVQGTKQLSGRTDLALGKKLWNDRFLGKSGLACANCHIDNYSQMTPTFKQPYPHQVAMPLQQAGVEQVNSAEMVQFCMVVPMMSDPLSWNSNELASLAAYVESLQSGYKPVSATGSPNPCNPN